MPSAAQRAVVRGASPSATTRTASAVEVAGTTTASGSRVRMKRAHWPLACGWDTTMRSASSSTGSRATRQWRIGCTSSPTITTSSVSKASASSVALTEPSSEFSNGTSARSTRPSWTAMTVVVDGRQRDRLPAAPPPGRRAAPPARRCPPGRGSPRARPRQSSASSVTERSSPGQREPDRLVLLGRELVLAAAGEHRLAVQPRRVAVGDAREHDAVVGGVEQRERRGLVARRARRRRRSARARGRRSRRRAGPRRWPCARPGARRPPRRGRAGRRRRRAGRPRGPRGRARRGRRGRGAGRRAGAAPAPPG